MTTTKSRAGGIVGSQMLFALRCPRLARVRVTVAYAVIVTGVTLALLELGPHVQDRVIRHASTNLHNLSHGHIGTLLGSAFVIDAGPIYFWLPGLVCLLALAELPGAAAGWSSPSRSDTSVPPCWSRSVSPRRWDGLGCRFG